MSMRITIVWVVTAVLAMATVSFGNWVETFEGGQFDLETWNFLAYPQVTGTFVQPILEAEDGTHYMAFDETESVGVGGAAFGAGFGSDETFTDVRVGAVVNVAGDASHNYHGLLARARYIFSDGTATPAPGVIADCYLMHIDWDGGPANLKIDLEKAIQNQNIMDEDIEVLVPNLANARSYYAELDVVGSGPVYVTGSLYEYKGGPLVARTPTMVDTSGNDWWEDPDRHDEVFTEGISGIFAQNEQPEPAGFHTTFGSISALSDGPSAVALYPLDGATDASIVPVLQWVEAAFATGRQVWFGTPGNLEMVDPSAEGASFSPGLLEPGTTYQWRIDQIGSNGPVEGHTWQFTTGQTAPVDDFELYADTADIAGTWVHNIEGGFEYIFLETGTVNQGGKALRFEYQNQYEPFVTEATRTFEAAQDWTVSSPSSLCVTFRGRKDNAEQSLFVRVEDAAGNQATVTLPYSYAVQSDPWRTWDVSLSDITDAGVDLTAVQKLTIGLGDGTSSGQEDDDRDTLYVDNICLR